ncbi:MAG: hypothetical protein LBS56_03590 [Propionibacteriaceae bacterium]|nr:hypothetical protein [Propionibacteriaceae bacterium]
MSGPPGLLRRAWKSLVAGDETEPEPTDPDPTPAGPQPIARAQAGWRVDFRGGVAAADIVAHSFGPWFEAELDDGTGSVTLVWMGHDSVPGVAAGRRLHVTGRLARDRGRLVVFNPWYALEPA